MIFALYVGGARDFLLILVRDVGYLRGQFGAGGLADFADYPIALRVVWTVNVLGGLAAPVLLLLRSRWAVLVAAASAAAQLVLLAVTFSLLGRWAALGTATSWFDLGIGVVTMIFAGYCWGPAAPRGPALT